MQSIEKSKVSRNTHAYAVSNFTTAMPDKGIVSLELQKRVSHPKIVISGKEVEESKKEYLEIMHDHKNAHFVMSFGGNRQLASPADSSMPSKLEQVRES